LKKPGFHLSSQHFKDDCTKTPPVGDTGDILDAGHFRGGVHFLARPQIRFPIDIRPSADESEQNVAILVQEDVVGIKVTEKQIQKMVTFVHGNNKELNLVVYL